MVQRGGGGRRRRGGARVDGIVPMVQRGRKASITLAYLIQETLS
jgi:hypothetical protein